VGWRAGAAPHHVSKEWSAKYKGRFDQGWDRLREEASNTVKKVVFDVALHADGQDEDALHAHAHQAHAARGINA
jgi:hypothetical protein